jgi:hypothetical protein
MGQAAMMPVSAMPATALDGRQAEDVAEIPFPHLASRDALPGDVAARLIEDLPSLEWITGTADWKSNRRFDLVASEALGRPDLPASWRDVIEAHLTSSFFARFVEVFGDAVRQAHPGLEERLGRSLEDARVGTRFLHDHRDRDVLLDAIVSINTPVTAKPTAVRRVHLDRPDKLFAGLLYLRHPDDDSTGGALELCRYRTKPGGFHDAEIGDRHVEVVKTVKYESNFLVMYPNSIAALHGVTPRNPTRFPRVFLNLVAELPFPLFDLGPHQATDLRNAIPPWARTPVRRVLDLLR